MMIEHINYVSIYIIIDVKFNIMRMISYLCRKVLTNEFLNTHTCTIYCIVGIIVK